jgi:GNAT superfamily N-acetyltransferase
VPLPVPEHIDRGLHRFGFRPRAADLKLMLAVERTEGPAPATVTVRAAGHDEIDLVASFWTSDRERPEFRTALDVAWSHPNPHERLVPLLAFLEDEAVSAAVVYRYRRSAGIYAVTTRESARGRGAASDLVAFALSTDPAGADLRYSILADSERLERRLERLGFRAARSFREYELPREAELALPRPGPPGPPQWRPPRGTPTARP